MQKEQIEQIARIELEFKCSNMDIKEDDSVVLDYDMIVGFDEKKGIPDGLVCSDKVSFSFIFSKETVEGVTAESLRNLIRSSLREKVEAVLGR